LVEAGSESQQCLLNKLDIQEQVEQEQPHIK